MTRIAVSHSGKFSEVVIEDTALVRSDDEDAIEEDLVNRDSVCKV